MNQKKVAIEKIYDLSPLQTGLLFHALKAPDSGVYFEQTPISIHGDIREEILEKSFNLILKKYEALRTAFIHQKIRRPKQVVRKNAAIRLHYEDLSRLDESQKEEKLEAFYRQDRRRGFDLAKDLLFRVALFKLADRDYKMVISFHHILMDGWCKGIIYRDLMQFYHALRRGLSPEPGATISNEKYYQWLSRRNRPEGLKFWREYLDGYERTAVLPQTGQPVDGNGYQVGEYQLKIGEALTRRLTEAAARSQLTLNSVLQTIWGVLLQVYNNTDDVVFGVVVSGRPPDIEDIEHMVGLFINTVPLRVRRQPRQTFSRLARQVQEYGLQSRPYEYLSLTEIQGETPLKGDLIDHIMAFENYPITERIREVQKTGSAAFQIKSVEAFEITSYDFNVIITMGRKTLVLLTYNSRVFKPDFVEKVAGHLKELIVQVAEDLDISIDALQLSHDFLAARSEILAQDQEDWI